MRPIIVAGFQSLLDKQPSETGAVDEEIARDTLAAIEHDRVDETIVAENRLHDFAFRPTRAACFRVLAQKTRIQRGIEMVGIRDVRKWRRRRNVLRRRHKFIERRSGGVEGVSSNIVSKTLPSCLDPELME